MEDVVIGALYAGLIVGAIPAICGAIKGNIKLGVLGFVSCLVAGLVLGLLLSIPVCAIFLYKIFNDKEVQSVAASKFCGSCGCAINNNTLYCPKCGRPISQ